MLSPSLVNDVARELLARRELCAQLLEDAYGPAGVLWRRKFAESHRQCRAEFDCMIEDLFPELRAASADSRKTGQQGE